MKDLNCRTVDNVLEPYVVSSSVMMALQSDNSCVDDIFCGMIDAGANISMGSLAFATALGAEVHPPTDDRKIGTADKSQNQLDILGWVYLSGYTGPIAIVDSGFLLLSTCQMQKRGMSTMFPKYEAVCQLSNSNGWFATLDQCERTKLYYIDIRCLLDVTMIPYVAQSEDVPMGPDTLQGGWAGYFLIAATDLIIPPMLKQKQRQLSASVIFRVWRLHRRLLHANLETIACDIESGRIINADVTPVEIRSVISHQDCFSCALAKWNRKNKTVSTGVHPNIIGQCWSIDYIGPYSVLANGGFNAEFVAVELSCGYIVVFLVKSKTEASRCVKDLSLLCKRFGHRMEKLRVDFGTVERGAEFIQACSLLNSITATDGVHLQIDSTEKGVEVLPSAPERQQQNPVERYIQQYKNLKAANMVDQDLLGASFWGWAGIATAKGMNSTSNSLCLESNPLFIFEGKRTNLQHMFKHSFGQAVISTKMGKLTAGCDTKNEFGVVVCPGHPGNGTSLIHFPSAGTRLVSPRYDVREINLGNRPRMTFEEGKSFLPKLAPDGSWHLVTRGDSNILAKQCAASVESELVAESLNTDDGLLTTTVNSSCAADEVFSELANRGLVAHVPLVGGIESLANVDVNVESVESNIPEQSQVSNKFSSRPIRSTAGKSNWYQPYATVALRTDLKSDPDVSLLLANVIISQEEFMRKNPKWSKAKVGPDKEKWLAADDKEREQMFDPQHCSLKEIPEGLAGVPKGVRVLPIKRVCRIKDGEQYKMRWCVLGNLDNYGGDTFAPTVCKKLVWLVFAVSTLLGLKNQFFDIKGAFMAERSTREVYVSIDGKVYLLLNSVYGLMDAPKIFNDGLVDHLIAGGYKQSKWDQCFFVKWFSKFSFIYIIFHVDDFKVSGTDQNIIDEFHNHLNSKYTVTTTKDGLFLGIRIEQQADGSCIFTKPRLLQSVFDKFLPNGPSMSLPHDPISDKYIKNYNIDDSPLCDSTMFKSVIGKLLQHVDYRIDIAFAVSKISHRTASPRVKDLEALMYIIHYLYSTRDLGLILRAGDHESAKVIVQLRGYADYSHACHSNGKGQYTLCFDLVDASAESISNPLRRVLNTGMFYFKTWMAPTVDLASTEGECGVIVEAVKDAILLGGCLEEMHQTQMTPVPLYNDNQSSITLATRYSGNHKRVRYMLPRVNWLMEKSKEGIFKLLYMFTKDLPADFGTKRLAGLSFENGRARTMGHS